MSKMETLSLNEYRVRLIGVLGSSAGNRETTIHSPTRLVLSDLVAKLLKQVDKPQFQELLIDSSTGNPLPNVIILLDEHDCNLFQGLRTVLEPGTLVTIIPVAHGG